jgi:hypothetical protein
LTVWKRSDAEKEVLKHVVFSFIHDNRLRSAPNHVHKGW